MKSKFKNKSILILGGSGSIGERVLESVLKFSPKKVIVFSRNEYKQYQLHYRYSHLNNIHYILGDIRDLPSVSYAAQGVDLIFHCAALKHVPFSEEMPEEFIKTNILGSINVMKAAILHRVPKTVSISTDKVVDPSNLMGLTKAVQEKIFSSYNLKKKSKKGLQFVNVRFGNVIGTHGSFFPIVYHQIVSDKPVTITHPDMTRFFISAGEAIDLIFWATLYGKDGEIIVRKMKSVQIPRVVTTFLKILKKKKNWPVKNIGIRAGEKMHELLVTEDNLFRTREVKGYYVIAPYNSSDAIVLRDKKPKFNLDQFSSHNPQNFFSDRELEDYVNLFLNEARLKNTII